MVSLEVEKGVLKENSCKFSIEGDNVLLFIDMEEVFKGLDKVKDEELRKFKKGNPSSIGLHSREHCDAIVIERCKNNELIIKIVELTANPERELSILLNKTRFCDAFVSTLLERSLRLTAEKVTYVAVLVVSRDVVNKVEKYIERNRGIMFSTHRPSGYHVGMKELIVKACEGQP